MTMCKESSLILFTIIMGDNVLPENMQTLSFREHNKKCYTIGYLLMSLTINATLNIEICDA